MAANSTGTSAGTGTTPLPKKLGIKPGHRVALLNAPGGFAATLAPLPEAVEVVEALDSDSFDVILWFGTERAGLERIVKDVRAVLEPAGGLWIGWPKRASGIPTEVTDDIVREVALPTGLVDNKICAIDAAWSGIRLVVRRELRGL
ncbi:DUF3052 family protein [Actinospica sp. MGRD01-02]|uniref:DUF3052 family protein n=1 Tax=Actinospica acidithermotolerans TaxID=2828514 RepID=A0A941ECF9_9ACTN|nr:DUF3052 family protein [Actinospica acidithermotolerans]MBR7827898.1 DUF3052 family protein [Actinospica acidithermotolerans]